jgi:hypothetical protein
MYTASSNSIRIWIRQTTSTERFINTSLSPSEMLIVFVQFSWPLQCDLAVLQSDLQKKG